MTEPKIVYRYKPANEGDSFISLGVPARNLTEEDVALLSPEARVNITAIGPSGKPMYVEVEEKPEAEPEPKAGAKPGKADAS